MPLCILTYRLNSMFTLVFVFVFLALISGVCAIHVWQFFGSPHKDFQGGYTYIQGQILSSYGRWLCEKGNKYEQGQLEEAMLKAEADKQKDANYYLERIGANPYKALGLCVSCFAFHFGNLFGTVSALGMYVSGLFPWFYLLIFAWFWGLSLAFSKLYLKLIVEPG